jgi:6,7-dimethyl-8-ribityllumazine synthase
MNTKSFDRDGNREFLADKRVAIIVADFYKEIADNLLNSSIETIEHYGCKASNIDIYRLPGAFEIPLMAKKLAQTGNFNGIITLGAVIRGETPHFDYVCNECARGVADVSYQFEIPTAFGVLTTENMDQTVGRSGGYKGNKGEEAALAMIEMIYLLDNS